MNILTMNILTYTEEYRAVSVKRRRVVFFIKSTLFLCSIYERQKGYKVHSKLSSIHQLQKVHQTHETRRIFIVDLLKCWRTKFCCDRRYNIVKTSRSP